MKKCILKPGPGRKISRKVLNSVAEERILNYSNAIIITISCSHISPLLIRTVTNTHLGNKDVNL